MAEDRAESGQTGETAQTGPTEPELPRCDFCGEPSRSVRRVALDHDYDRLQKPHAEQYACRACSEKKERSRLGLERD